MRDAVNWKALAIRVPTAMVGLALGISLLGLSDSWTSTTDQIALTLTVVVGLGLAWWCARAAHHRNAAIGVFVTAAILLFVAACAGFIGALIVACSRGSCWLS